MSSASRGISVLATAAKAHSRLKLVPNANCSLRDCLMTQPFSTPMINLYCIICAQCLRSNWTNAYFWKDCPFFSSHFSPQKIRTVFHAMHVPEFSRTPGGFDACPNFRKSQRGSAGVRSRKDWAPRKPRTSRVGRQIQIRASDHPIIME